MRSSLYNLGSKATTWGLIFGIHKYNSCLSSSPFKLYVIKSTQPPCEGRWSLRGYPSHFMILRYCHLYNHILDWILLRWSNSLQRNHILHTPLNLIHLSIMIFFSGQVLHQTALTPSRRELWSTTSKELLGVWERWMHCTNPKMMAAQKMVESGELILWHQYFSKS